MPQSKLIGVLLLAPLVFGFQGSQSQPAPALTSPDTVHAPVPTYKQEPRYTEEGKAAHIQGIVMLQLVVDQQGRPTQITVLSPLGYGLDEAAIDAVAHWRFEPGTKGGKPVNVLAQVQVTFRFQNQSFDAKVEKQRTDFNVALHAVQQGPPNKVIVKSLQDLAAQKYPAGLYLYGKILEDGRGVSADAEQGFHLIQEAADKKYGPALYDIAEARLQGTQLEKDPAKGMELMRSAAKLGSRAAQMFLGEAYEQGNGVSADLEKSRQYFRLCAAQGDALCQFRLGRSLLEHSENPDRDYVQAIAWLQLASEHGVEDAEKILQQEDARVTPAQLRSAKQLMTQLVHAQ
jgi:TonB family protein